MAKYLENQDIIVQRSIENNKFIFLNNGRRTKSSRKK